MASKVISQWAALRGLGARRRSLRFLAHLAIGLLFMLLFMRQVDMGAVIAALARARPSPLLIALFAYAVDFLLRATRFRLLLERVSGRSLPWRRVPGPFIASFGISDLLPLRAGDVFRLLWFQRNMALPASAVLGAMMIERFYDLLALLLLAVVILAWHFGGWLFYLGLLAGLGLLTVPVLLLGNWVGGWRWAWARGLAKAIDSFRILRSPRLLLKLLGLSLGCWLLEAVVLLGAWISLGGAAADWLAPMAAFVTSTLGTLLPGLPGHFGTFELFGMEMFRRGGVPQDFAAAVLLLAHMLLWAPTALFAILWLPFGNSGKAAQ